MTEKPVLLTLGNHTQTPMWKGLAESYRLAFLSSQAADLAASMGIDAIKAEAYLPFAEMEDARGRALLMAGEVTDALADGRVAFDSVLPRFSPSAMTSWFLPAFYDQACAVIGRLKACEALRQKEGIAGILVHEDVTPEGRTLALFGNAHGIPTLHQPHANHFLEPGTGDIHCDATAQFIGASGTYMRDWYKACGVPEERIAIVGRPAWDKLYDEDILPSRAKAKYAFGVYDDRFVLAYATTWYQMTSAWGDPEADLLRSLDRVLDVAKEIGAFVIVKQHPGEGQTAIYEKKLKELGLKGAITRHWNEFALRAADVLVTQGPSNIGVEAAILGTPVVEMFQCGARYPDFGPEGTWGEDLLPLISDACARGALAEFAEAMSFRTNRPAAEVAIDWVRGIVQ